MTWFVLGMAFLFVVLCYVFPGEEHGLPPTGSGNFSAPSAVE